MAITSADVSRGTSKTINNFKVDAKDTNPINLSYDSKLEETEAKEFIKEGKFASDTRVIDASKIGAKLVVDADLTGATLSSFTGGAGNDNITLSADVTVVNGGKGKDTFVVTDGAKNQSVVISDYTAGQDTVKIADIDLLVNGSDFSQFGTLFNDYTLDGRNVHLNLNGGDEGTDTTTVVLQNAKDSIVTIVDKDDKVLFNQSFQVGGSEEYDATDKNTGNEVYSNAKFIDASSRAKPITIYATQNSSDVTLVQQIVATGKNDSINVSNVDTSKYTTITTGKGNDTVDLVNGNHIILTDYQVGNKKEVIKLGSGLKYYDYRVNGNDVLLKFYDTKLKIIDSGYGDGTSTFNPKKDDPSASIWIKNGVWNQLGNNAKFLVSIVDSNGGTIDGSGAYQDPSILYVTKVDAKNGGTVADLNKNNTIGAANFTLDKNVVDSVVFTPGTAVSVKAGGGFEAVTGGGGKDTLTGGDEAFNSTQADPYTDEGAKTRHDLIISEPSDVGILADQPEKGKSTLWFDVTISGIYGDAKMRVNVVGSGSSGQVGYVYDMTGGDYANVSGDKATVENHHKGQISDDGKGKIDVVIGRYVLHLKDMNQITVTAGAFDAGSMRAGAKEIAAIVEESANEQGYNYVYDSSQTTLNGGKGNDYLYGNVSGGYLAGDVGNDTLRGGRQQTATVYETNAKDGKKVEAKDADDNNIETQIGGAVFFEGGAGNDTFLLTGEGPATIGDYNSGLAGKDEDATVTKANKAALGSDIVVVQYDAYNGKKNNEYSGRATLTGSEWTGVENKDGSTYLKLNVSGNRWITTEGVFDSTAGADEQNGFVRGHFNDVASDTDVSGSYLLKVTAGDQVVVQDQGIKYTQYISSDTNVTELNGNYLGLLNPNAVSISGENGTKAMRLVAGEKTTAIVGGKGADTLVNDNGVEATTDTVSTTLTGGAGNDIYIVNSGETIQNETRKSAVITDYDGANLNSGGKDIIQVRNIAELGMAADKEENVQENSVASLSHSSFTYSLKKSDGTAGGSVTVNLETTETGSAAKPTLFVYNASTGEYDDVATDDPTEVKYVHVVQFENKTDPNVLVSAAFAINDDDYIQVTSDDYGAENILKRINKTTYIEKATNKFENKITSDGNVFIGGIQINGGASHQSSGNKTKYQTITFRQMDEVLTTDKKTGEVTGSKNVAKTMVRTFSNNSLDSVISGGASDYFEIYDGLDNNVKVVKASTKGGTLVNGAKNVESIVGGGKIDSIVVGRNTDGNAITMQSGGGNDVIVWDGHQDVVVTDFTAAAFNAKGVFSGDVIQTTFEDGFGDSGDSKISKEDLKFDGDDVIIEYDHNGTINTLTLTKAKGKAIFVNNTGKDFDASKVSFDGDNVTGDLGNTIDSSNSNEYLLGAKDTYDESKASDDDIHIVNLTAGKAPMIVNGTGNEKLGTVYGGKGADTIEVLASQLIDAGAGNDVVYLNGTLKDGNHLTVAGGAGNDFFIVSGKTKNVEITDYTTTADRFAFGDNVGDEEAEEETTYHIIGAKASTGASVYDKKAKSNITTTDVTLFVSSLKVAEDGNAAETATIKLSSLIKDSKDNSLKITRSDDGLAGKNYYSLDYVSDNITITSKDFKNAVVNVEGINADEITIDKATSVSVRGAGFNGENKTVKVQEGSKKAVFYIGESVASDTATVSLGGGNDVYEGHGASDTVVLGAGNNTVTGDLNNAIVTSGSNAKNVFVAGEYDKLTIEGFTADDQIAFVADGEGKSQVEITSATVLEGGVLRIRYNTGTSNVEEIPEGYFGYDEDGEYLSAGENEDYNGEIYLTSYTGSKVTFSDIVTDTKGKVSIKARDDAHGYTDGTSLNIADTDGSSITFDATANTSVTEVNAGNRTAKKAVLITATTDSKVQTIIGGAGADTLDAVARVDEIVDEETNETTGYENYSITYRGGAGNDTFVIHSINSNVAADVDEGTEAINATYTVEDYTKGDVLLGDGTSLFTKLANYSSDYEFVGEKDILIGTVGGDNVLLKDAQGQEVSFKANAEAAVKKVTFSDPVNVVLTAKDKDFDWTAKEGTTYNSDRVKSFNATAATGAVTFKASNAEFDTFKSGAKGATLDLSKREAVTDDDGNTTTAVKDATIELGGGTNNITLDTNGTADTIKVAAKSTTTITNFDANDSIGTVAAKDVNAKSTDNTATTRAVNLTLKSGKLSITSTADIFELSTTNFKAKTKNDEGNTTFTFDKVVKINGMGDVVYGTGITEGYYASADAAAVDKAVTAATSLISKDFNELVDDFVMTDSLSEITSAKVAISADDLKSSLNNTTSNFDLKITSNSDLTSNKKQD